MGPFRSSYATLCMYCFFPCSRIVPYPPPVSPPVISWHPSSVTRTLAAIRPAVSIP